MSGLSPMRVLREYFENTTLSTRVKVGAFDISKVSKFEAAFGGMAYKAHACLGCHQVERTAKLIGGPQSTSLAEAGQRYKGLALPIRIRIRRISCAAQRGVPGVMRRNCNYGMSSGTSQPAGCQGLQVLRTVDGAVRDGELPIAGR
jgi:cytochrome c551/c552